MPTSSIHFLINTRSGGRRGVQLLRKLTDYAQLNSKGIVVEAFAFDNLPAQIARAQKSDILVIGGGDGTVSRLLPLLSGCSAQIGILPLGTGNDLARELEVFSVRQINEPDRIVAFYRSARARNVTVFNAEYGEAFALSTPFINYLSIGFDAKVVASFANLRSKKYWKVFRGEWGNRLGYLLSSIGALRHTLVGNPELTLNSEALTVPIRSTRSLLFTNISSIMGLGRSSLHASIFDDNIECLSVTKLIQYATMLTHYRLPFFHPTLIGRAQAWEVHGLPQQMHMQVDGEPIEAEVSGQLRISAAGSLSVLVGKRFTTRE